MYCFVGIKLTVVKSAARCVNLIDEKCWSGLD
jgi:hypothetical protein